MASADNLPDGIPLDDIALLRKKYGLDDKAVEAVQYITKNVPIAGIGQLIGADYFLRHLITTIETGTDNSKLRALEMLGRYLGLFDQKRKGSGKKVVIQ